MSTSIDYDRRKPQPENHVVEAHDAHDPTKTYFLYAHREDDGVIIMFAEERGGPSQLHVRDFMHIDADQCEQFGNALLAAAKIIRERPDGDRPDREAMDDEF